MHALACGLGATHEVHLVDGGRPVPHDKEPAGVQLVRVPRLARVGEQLVAVEPTVPVAEVLQERSRMLAHAVERIRPDVVLIDQYPFSKWELDAEVEGVVAVARQCNPGTAAWCSLRDIARQTRHERVTGDVYTAQVLKRLRAFDGILVHADPAFTRLDEHFTGGANLPVPVRYTGFVTAPGVRPASMGTSRCVVVSCGGGVNGIPLLIATMTAFRRLASEFVSWRLVVFAPAFATPSDLAALAEAGQGARIDVRPFSPEFHAVLGASALSISRAGYNTCVRLLQAKTRAVLVPDSGMRDQQFRAQRFAELGLAQVVENEHDVDGLMHAMRCALAVPPPRHDLNLDGVGGTLTAIGQGATSARSFDK